jgi:hypothetical protein
LGCLGFGGLFHLGTSLTDGVGRDQVPRRLKKIKKNQESHDAMVPPPYKLVITHQYFASSGVISITTGLPCFPPRLSPFQTRMDISSSSLRHEIATLRICLRIIDDPEHILERQFLA